jgi:hypothetical protein
MEGIPKPDKKIYTAAEIGAPVSTEKIPAKELFKGSLSFDFVFALKDGKKHPYCVEINGDQSGIAGIQNIDRSAIDSTRRIMAGIRDQRDPAYRNNIQSINSIIGMLNTEKIQLPDDAKGKLHSLFRSTMAQTPMFPHAHQNPDFIKRIADDKLPQAAVIPEEHHPRVLDIHDPNRQSSTGTWILKPRRNRGGEGIQIISNDEIEILDDDTIFDRYVIQEFVHPLSAELAGETKSDHAASMRLLIDFRYLEDGTIEPTYEAAYQRVATEPLDISVPLGSREQSAVVNLTRAADSYPASSEELALAHPVAEEIIHTLAYMMYPDLHLGRDSVLETT